MRSQLLPEQFAKASCWWQATGSAGIKPGIRRTAVVLAEQGDQRRPGQGLADKYPVDRSLFTPVALHYTAPPVLAPGTPDPMTHRCGVRQACRRRRGTRHAADGREGQCGDPGLAYRCRADRE